jgi:hypothetical protein
MSKNPVVIGDLRQELARDLERALYALVCANKHRDFYYVTAHARQDRLRPGIFKTTLMLTSVPPPMMLATACYFVDNRLGKIEKLWVLPLDTPRAVETVSGEFVPEICEAAKRMPIVY